MSARLSPIVLCAAALLFTLSVGCAYPAPRGQSPLYALDTTWFNDPIGGMRPWKAEDRRAATRASQVREDRWAGVKASRSKRPSASDPVVVESPTARRSDVKKPKKRKKKRKRGTRDDRSSRKKKKKTRKSRRRSRGAVVARIAPPVAVTPPPRRPEGLVLGDGSVGDELVAAAERLVGIRDALEGPAFLEHVLTVAVGDLSGTGGKKRTVKDIWEGLRDADRTLSDPAQVQPGYLAFFRATHDLDGDGQADDTLTMAAVVERIRPSGVMVCIAEIHGEVQRFVVDPRRPQVRRDEGSGEMVNTPLRWRSMGEQVGSSVLAGSLVRGFARM